jgi:hypothetical protein
MEDRESRLEIENGGWNRPRLVESFFTHFQFGNPKSEFSHPRGADNNDQSLSALKEKR